MTIFSDITLQWNGKDYTIPHNRVMKAIAAVEDIITLDEINRYAARGTAPLGKLSSAYAAVLQLAGAKVTDAEVYHGMFTTKDQANIMNAIAGLLTMMVPPDVLKNISTAEVETASGN